MMTVRTLRRKLFWAYFRSAMQVYNFFFLPLVIFVITLNFEISATWMSSFIGAWILFSIGPALMAAWISFKILDVRHLESMRGLIEDARDALLVTSPVWWAQVFWRGVCEPLYYIGSYNLRRIFRRT